MLMLCIRYMALRLSLSVAAFGLAAGLAPLVGEAADFKWVKTEYCDVTVSGPLADGDNAKLIALLKKHPTKTKGVGEQEARLCLSVRGGSFVEALKIAKYMGSKNIATVVPADAECVGACAIIFMAGVIEDNPYEADARRESRLLHIHGRLEFNTLGSQFAPGSYTKEKLERAYTQGVAALVTLTELDIVPIGLLIELALLGPDASLSMNSVGKAREYGIRLAGLPAPTGSQEDQARTACGNRVSKYDRRTGAFKLPTEEGACKAGCVTGQRYVDREKTGTEFSVRFDEGAKLGCIVRFQQGGKVYLRLFTDTVPADWGASLDSAELIANDTPIGRSKD